MAISRRRYGKGRKTRKLNRTSFASAERVKQRALGSKGKGSVARIWAMARSAGYRGQIGLAGELVAIAKKRVSFAKRIKR